MVRKMLIRLAIDVGLTLGKSMRQAYLKVINSKLLFVLNGKSDGNFRRWCSVIRLWESCFSDYWQICYYSND